MLVRLWLVRRAIGNQLQWLIFPGNSQPDTLVGKAVSIPDGLAIYSRVTGKQEMVLPERKLVLQTAGWDNRRSEVPPPENLLVKWRSHAGCGFNLSTVCFP